MCFISRISRSQTERAPAVFQRNPSHGTRHPTIGALHAPSPQFALGLWQLSDVTERQSLARQMFSDWLEMYHTLLATPPADVVFPGSRFVRGSVNPNDLYKGFRTIAIAFASKDVPYREGPSWHLFPT